MIVLINDAVRAVIDPAGAWVAELSVDNQAIFYPKTDLVNDAGEVKTRGGMHICLPNFGPGGDSGLPQHGFGRVLEWRVLSQAETNVRLVLEAPEGLYETLQAELSYELAENGLASRLSVQNTGTEALRLAPAFHPYFSLDPAETEIDLNGQKYQLAALAGTEFAEAESFDFTSDNRKLKLEQQGLPIWAIWTDQLGDYVCVEPTLGGYRFLEAPKDDEMLAPGETKTYVFTISW